MDDFEARVTERLDRIEKRQTALLVLACVCVIWLCGLSLGSDLTIAVQDRQQFAVSDWSYLYYFGTGHLDRTKRDEAAAVLMFAICSLNDEPVIEQQLPVQVAPTVWRLDTRQVGWQHALPKMLKTYYPYSYADGQVLLLVRADWFVQAALDQTVTGNSYFELIYGKAPKNLNEFLGFLGTTQKTSLELGHIEARSGVAVQGTRLIKTLPTLGRQDVWITFDAEEINRKTDPLENLDRSQKFDASEIIGALPKSVASTGEMGHLQVYGLANAQGQMQTKAPANIVTDHTNIRGVEILNACSCISCHASALQPLKDNALRKFIVSGAEAYADYKTQTEIERFHLSRLDTMIERHNEDYARIVWAINAMTPELNAAAFRSVVQAYDSPLSLADAARELWCKPDDLRHALALYGRLPARLSQLAHGLPIPRSSWESEYRIAWAALQQWRRTK